MPPSQCETSAFATSRMGRFAITLTAAALAAAIAGPASADLMEGSNPGAYSGDATKVKITAGGCKNESFKGQSAIGFSEQGPFQGCWEMEFFSFGETFGPLGGSYIERKVGKDLTLGLDAASYAAVLDVLRDYVGDPLSTCDLGTNPGDFDTDDFVVKKAQGKVGKTGDRIRVSIEVSGKFTNSDNKKKNLKIKIDGTMNFDSNAPNTCPLVPTPTSTPTATPTPTPTQSKKVTVCHNGKRSISVSANAVPAHLAHGDTLGACP